MQGSDESKILTAIASVLLPPLGVALAGGGVGAVLLNILLTVCGFWLLGVVHALWWVFKD